jgi:glycosyltransferase involved in cell wall biosynthesis
MDRSPLKVSIILPCRNEVDNIEDCLEKILNLQPPLGGYEIIVIDGVSDDGTRDVIYKKIVDYPNLRLLDNPKKIVPSAMNIGIEAAKGEYIIRVDARCIHPENYIVELLKLMEQTQADNVGGVLTPIGKSYLQKGIAAAYKSKISMGSALRERNNFIGKTDTVYGGCFKKEKLKKLGYYDENMVRNQDDELSFRLRKEGGKIIQSTDIKIKYYPRKNLRQLFKQFMQYGFWKVFVIIKHPKQASFRHFVPAILVFGLITIITTSFYNWFSFFLIFIYFFIVLIESGRVTLKTKKKLFPAIITSIITIHFSFGFGFIIGIFSWLFKINLKYFSEISR